MTLSNKFHFMQFWNQICPKRVFSVENEKVNITIEFFISELVWVLNFTLNKQLSTLGSNLRKNGIFGRKGKKLSSPLNSGYSN